MSSELFNGTDILPTIVNLVGGDIPSDRAIDGIDAFNAFLGKSVNREVSPIWFYPNHGDTYFRMPQISMRRDNYTLIGSLPEKDDSTKVKDWMANNDPTKFELYDVTKDLSQKQDLADKHPELISNMESEMISLWREMRDEGLSKRVRKSQ